MLNVIFSLNHSLEADGSRVGPEVVTQGQTVPPFPSSPLSVWALPPFKVSRWQGQLQASRPHTIICKNRMDEWAWSPCLSLSLFNREEIFPLKPRDLLFTSCWPSLGQNPIPIMQRMEKQGSGIFGVQRGRWLCLQESGLLSRNLRVSVKGV